MNYKKELFVGITGAFFIFALSGYYILLYRASRGSFATPTFVTNTLQLTTTLGEIPVLTQEMIAKHNSPSDCWIIIHNSVYRVTDFLSAHPGGANKIIPYCGGDATVAYNTKGGRGAHSSSADQILSVLKIGNVSK
jgi:cytochrome b involved in lipid metabolism